MLIQKKEWVDFNLKIVYIYDIMFKNDKEKLMSYFCSTLFTPEKRATKIKTINNWLSGKTKKPNKFNIHLFKISEYKMSDGSILLPHEAFEFWSFEKFKKRVDDYLSNQYSKIPLREKMKYIYFFDIDSMKLDYFEIYFPKEENTIHLLSEKYSDGLQYKGRLVEYQNMFYLFFKNDFDHMIYLFDNIDTIANKEVKVLGTGQGKDYYTRKPKVYLSLLTSNKLSVEEEKKYTNKLNHSNFLIAKPFSRKNRVEEDYFIENFTYKMKILGKDLDNYIVNKETDSTDPYYSLALQAHKPCVQISKKLSNREDFFVSNKENAQKLIFKTLCSQDKAKIEILYTLTPYQITLLDRENSTFNQILQQQIGLVEQKKLDLTYLFVLTQRSSFCAKLIKKLEEIEKSNIKVRVVEDKRVHYAKIILSDSVNTVISQNLTDQENNIHITKHKKDIRDLHSDYRLFYRQSKSLKDFLSYICPLNGRWYSYSYGSQIDYPNYHTVEFEINNGSIIGSLPMGINHGVIQKSKLYTLLLFDNTIIKIHNKELKEDIFRISIIGEEHNIADRDVMLFGLMSKRALVQTEIHLLLDKIQAKEEKNFRLKISDEFSSQLARFKKYEKRDLS